MSTEAARNSTFYLAPADGGTSITPERWLTKSVRIVSAGHIYKQTRRDSISSAVLGLPPGAWHATACEVAELDDLAGKAARTPSDFVARERMQPMRWRYGDPCVYAGSSRAMRRAASRHRAPG